MFNRHSLFFPLPPCTSLEYDAIDIIHTLNSVIEVTCKNRQKLRMYYRLLCNKLALAILVCWWW